MGLKSFGYLAPRPDGETFARSGRDAPRTRSLDSPKIQAEIRAEIQAEIRADHGLLRRARVTLARSTFYK